MERRDLVLELVGAGQGTDRILVPLQPDVQRAEVVYRPGVAVVLHNRTLIRHDRVIGLALRFERAALQPQRFARRRIERDRLLDVLKGAVRLLFLEQHTAQVEVALDVRRIDRERLHERTLGLGAIARLPRRQAKHVEAPRIVGPAFGVGLEEHGGVIVAPRAIGGIRYLERNGSADHERRLFGATAVDVARRHRTGRLGDGLAGTSLIGRTLAARGKSVGGDRDADDCGHQDDRKP